MEMIIRPGKPEDAAACADIHKRSWIYAYSHCISRELIEQRHKGRVAMWEKFLANEAGGNFVVGESGELRGRAMLAPTSMYDSLYRRDDVGIVPYEE